MAKNVSKVYDIVYPSPVTLQEISSIAVAVQIWRSELKKYILNDALHDFHPENESKQNTSLPDDVISNLPSVIHCMIQEHYKELMNSIYRWMEHNFRYIFEFHRENFYDILNDFNDIACNFDGTVHYDRTAKRMLHCDGISQVEKFRIACAYCFEDDIRKMWPSVESQIDLRGSVGAIFYPHPYLFYWMCRIENNEECIQMCSCEETIVTYNNTESRSAFEYFWNRISLEKQSEIALELCWKREPRRGFYSKLIIPKLSDQQKSQILSTVDNLDWFYFMLINDAKDSLLYIMPIWMCVKNNINEISFRNLTKKLFWIENGVYISNVSSEKASRHDEILTICCDMWNNAPHHLKRAAMKHIFNDHQLIESHWKPQPRKIKFLLAVLSDATSEEKTIFWDNNWLSLLISVSRINFLNIMKLCLNEKQIHKFKETTMSKYENIQKAIESYFQEGCFQDLKDFVSFCCPDQISKRILYRKVLQPDFFHIHNILNLQNICKAKQMREFFDDIYADDSDLSTDFKNNFWLYTQDWLVRFVESFYLNEMMNFVDTFASYGQNLDKIKKELVVEKLKSYIDGGALNGFCGDKVQKFLFWCLGKEDENEMNKFKQSILPDQVLDNMVQNGKMRSNSEAVADSLESMIEYPPTLDPFLSWYFVSREEIDEFKTRLADVFKRIKAPDEILVV